MRRNPLDDRTADRLLAGAVTSEDAPSGYAGVAALLHAAHTGPVGGELARETATVASMSSVVVGHPVPMSTPRGKTMLTKILTAKVAAVAAVGLLTATGAAAATNSLPSTAQSTVADALSNVGIDVPSPNAASAGHADHSTDASKPSTATPNSHASFGLCTAANASAGNPNTNSAVPSSTSTTCVPHPGQPTDPGSQGQANKPKDPGSQGEAHKPSTPAGPPSATPAGEPPASTPASGTAPVTTPNRGTGAIQSGDNSSTGAGAASSHPGRP